MPRFSNAALVAALLFMAIPASPHRLYAQQAAPSQPDLTTATYRAWTLRCAARREGQDGGAGEAVQGISLNGQPAGQVVVGRLSPDQSLHLMVQLPLGVWLPANVRLDAAEGANATATYTLCRQLCMAEADLDGNFVQALRQSPQPMTITFQNGARQPVSVNIPLDGFDAAMNAMNAEMEGE